MKTGQTITYIRGDDLSIPVTVTLDNSRTLDGTETWSWTVKKDVRGSALLSKTSASSSEISVDGSTYQPTILVAPSDFSAYRSSATDQSYVHELQMVKDTKTERPVQQTLTLRTN